MAEVLDLKDPIALLSGVPFLDEEFADKRLLAAVAAGRHVTAERRGLSAGVSEAGIEAWLAPSRAMLLAEGGAMPAAPLLPTQRAQVDAALAGLARLIPAWAPLTKLPVRYALLHPANGAISASSRAWPQHVLLAEEAFASAVEVREQTLHELCHQWLYLLEEVWRLETGDAVLGVLPSGTAQRSPAEVLGAAHVATALIRLYTVADDTPAGRLSALREYRDGCLGLLDSLTENLTDVGRGIAQRLKEVA